jgi:predicted Zn-dependent peptidase
VGHEELEQALLGEIERLKTDGPSAEELERVRNLHAAGVESGLQRLAERADRLSMYTVLFDAPEMINTEVSRYEAVDGERVRAAMADTLRDDNRVVLTYLPADVPEPEPEVEAAAIAGAEADEANAQPVEAGGEESAR